MLISHITLTQFLRGVIILKKTSFSFYFGSSQARGVQRLFSSSEAKRKYLLKVKFTPIGMCKRFMSDSSDSNENRHDLNISAVWGSIEHDTDYEEFSQNVFRMKHQGHTVLVVQPYKRNLVKSQNKDISHPALRLAEAVALAQSIPNWKVVSAVAYSVASLKSEKIFGSGNLGKIVFKLRKDESISAVFISVDILNIAQLAALQKIFEVPVYDRYTVVIQIFHNHARSKEAKLQVAMAEIPYLWQCLDGLPEGLEDRLGNDFALVGGAGTKAMEQRREMLKRREQKIRAELEDLARQRQMHRLKRIQSRVPSVAIVGYTNAGKTSLIQVLTREIKIQPKNRLFATLDVSSHRTKLPSGLDLVYIDTVGFMSDLPDQLIKSFKATLEDAMFADLLLHVWDVSHPESILQINHVTKTLNSLKVEKDLLQNVVIIGNKIDKVLPSQRQALIEQYPHVLMISCHTGEGVNELESLIENLIIKNTGRKTITLKVRSGSPEHLWLLDNATITKSDVHRDENYMLVNVLMTEGELNKFKSHFIVRRKQREIFE